MRAILLVGIAGLVSLAMSGMAVATENPVVHDVYSQAISEMNVHLSELQSNLQAEPVEVWTSDEVEDYLNTSLWVVFSGMMLYVNSENQLPDTPDDLISSGYLQAIPLNPFNNWEPVVIRSDTLEFYPGDLCLQRCQASANDPARQKSFELSIFGPTPSFSQYGYFDVNQHNEDWAVTPNGAVYQLGAAFKRATGVAEASQNSAIEGEQE